MTGSETQEPTAFLGCVPEPRDGQGHAAKDGGPAFTWGVSAPAGNGRMAVTTHRTTRGGGKETVEIVVRIHLTPRQLRLLGEFLVAHARRAAEYRERLRGEDPGNAGQPYFEERLE